MATITYTNGSAKKTITYSTSQSGATFTVSVTSVKIEGDPGGGSASGMMTRQALMGAILELYGSSSTKVKEFASNGSYSTSTASGAWNGTYSVSDSYQITMTKESQNFSMILMLNGSMQAVNTLTVPAKPSYTVSYNANGGSGAPGNQTKWYNESLKLSSTKPTFSGYVFKEWRTASNGTGTLYNPGESYTGNAVLTLYAIWNRTVTFNANGGTGAPSAQTAIRSSAITLSSTKPTLSGYSFKRWNTNTSDTGTAYNPGGSYAVNLASVTLYAIWNRTVTYNANGGTGAPSAQTAIKSSALTLSSTKPTLSGHNFVTWCTNQSGSGGDRYLAGASYPADKPNTTLYAIWKILPELALTVERGFLEEGVWTSDPFGDVMQCTALWVVDSGYSAVSLTFKSGEVTSTVSVSGTSGSTVEYLDLGMVVYDPKTVTCTILDSFQDTTVVSVLSEIPYMFPAIESNSLCYRCDSSGNPVDEIEGAYGTYMKAVVYWMCADLVTQRKPQKVRIEAPGVSYVELSGDDLVIDRNEVMYYDRLNRPVVYGHCEAILPGPFDYDKRFYVNYRVYDRAADKTMKDVLTETFYTIDALSDQYLYQPSNDTAYDSLKTYYQKVYVDQEWVFVEVEEEDRYLYCPVSYMDDDPSVQGWYVYDPDQEGYVRTSDRHVSFGTEYFEEDGEMESGYSRALLIERPYEEVYRVGSLTQDHNYGLYRLTNDPYPNGLKEYYVKDVSYDVPTDRFYEDTGPQPGHGISFGGPCKSEGFNVSMPLFYNYDQIFPTYARSSWSVNSDELSLGRTPCFVYDTSTGIRYWCSGNGISIVASVWG